MASTLSVCTIAQDEEECIAWHLNCCVYMHSILQDRLREVVIVDGGSKDSTVEVVKSFENRLPLILIEQPFDSFGQQKNRALDRATGDYILGVDADMTIGTNFPVKFKKGFYNDKNWVHFVLFSLARDTKFMQPKPGPTMRLWRHGPRFVTNFHEKLGGEPPGYRVDSEVPLFDNCFRVCDSALRNRGERYQQFIQQMHDAGCGPGPPDRYYNAAYGETVPTPEWAHRLIVPGS